MSDSLVTMLFYIGATLLLLLICGIIEAVIDRNPKWSRAVDRWILENIVEERPRRRRAVTLEPARGGQCQTKTPA